MLRLQADFARARARAGAAVDHAPPADEEAPHARHAAARNARLVAVLVAASAAALGAAGLFTVGSVSVQAPWMHVMLLALSMAFVGTGAYALQRPRGLPLAANAGTDAFGMQQFAPTQASTADQGRSFGVVMLMGGLVLLVLGVFFGALAG
jgi:hypothetical protein